MEHQNPQNKLPVEINRSKIILKHNKTLLSNKEEKRQLCNQDIIRIIMIEIILHTIYITTSFMIAYKLMYSRKEDVTHSWQYGVIMLIIQWLPAFALIPNEIYYETELVPSSNYLKLAAQTFICVILFPVLPLILNGKHIISSESKYFARLDTINSLNQVIFTSLHLTLLIFLTMRGHLNNEDEPACILNVNETSACILIPVLVAVTISMILYIKASSHLLTKESN